MFQSIKFVRHVIFKVILKENPVEKDDENEEAGVAIHRAHSRRVNPTDYIKCCPVGIAIIIFSTITITITMTITMAIAITI